MLKKYKLEIELVPKTAWYKNLRSLFSKEEWDYIRKKIYKRANYRCEICGIYNTKLEAHEEWDYDDKNKTFTLKNILCLCSKCHRCKHIGLAQIQGHFEECVKHLMKINNQTYQETLNQIDEAFIIWEERSKYNWEFLAVSSYKF